MPQHTGTILLIFILGSVCYKRHVTNWRAFHIATICFLMSCGGRLMTDFIVMSALGQLLYAAVTGLQITTILLLIRACTTPTESLKELRCLKCNYHLKGLSEPRCPECGWQI